MEELFNQLADAIGEEEQENQFSDRQLDEFFGSAVWKEIERILVIRRSVVTGKLMSIDTDRETDIAAKATISSIAYFLDMRNILEGKLSDEEK